MANQSPRTPPLCLADQFYQLPEHDVRSLAKYGITLIQQLLEEETNEEPLLPSLANVTINQNAVHTSVDNETLRSSLRAFSPLHSDEILSGYLKLICKTLNQECYNIVGNEFQKKTLPPYLYFSSSFWEPIRKAQIPKDEVDSLWYTLHLGTRLLYSYTKLDAKLETTPEENAVQLLDVEQIFISIERDRLDVHRGTGNENMSALLVISPPIRMIEYFDCHHNDGTQFIYYALEWLKFQLGDRFVLEDWRWRQNDNPCTRLHLDENRHPVDDPVPNPSLQESCITAFNVAFGLQVPGAGQRIFMDPATRQVREGLELGYKRVRIAVDLVNGYLAGRGPGNQLPPRGKNLYLGGRRRQNGQWKSTPIPHGTEPPYFARSTPVTRLQYCRWASEYRRDYHRGALPPAIDIRGCRDARLTILDTMKNYGWVDEGSLKKLVRNDGWTVELLKVFLYRDMEMERGSDYHKTIWKSYKFELSEGLKRDKATNFDTYRRREWSWELLVMRLYQIYDETQGHRILWNNAPKNFIGNSEPDGPLVPPATPSPIRPSTPVPSTPQPPVQTSPPAQLGAPEYPTPPPSTLRPAGSVQYPELPQMNIQSTPRRPEQPTQPGEASYPTPSRPSPPTGSVEYPQLPRPVEAEKVVNEDLPMWGM